MNPEISIRRLKDLIHKEYKPELRMEILNAISPMTNGDVEKAIGDALRSQSRRPQGQALVAFSAGLAIFLSRNQDQGGQLKVSWKEIRAIIRRNFTGRQQRSVQVGIQSFYSLESSSVLGDIKIQKCISDCTDAFLGKSRNWGVVGCAAALALTIDAIQQSMVCNGTRIN